MQLRGAIETSGSGIRGAIKNNDLSGYWIRAKANRSTKQGGRFQRQMGIASRLANHWKNVLSSTQRADWSVWAAAHPHVTNWSKTKILNGYQGFCRVNRARLTASMAITSNPPTSPTLPTGGIIRMVPVGENSMLVRIDNSYAWTRNPNAAMIIIDYGPQSPARNNQQNRGRILAVLRGFPIIGYPLPLIFPRPF